MATVIRALVAPSGKGTIVEARDSATGELVDIASMATNDEEQRLTVTGNPGGPFTTSMGGQPSSPISAAASPPLVYFQWNATLAAPGQYDLAVDLVQGGPFAPAVLYEVLDGSTSLGSKVINQQDNIGGLGGPVNAGMFDDSALLNEANAPVKWYPLGRFTLATTSLKVRVSAPSTPAESHFFNVDCLRVAPVSGGNVQVVDSSAGPAAVVDGIGGQVNRYPAAYQVAGSAPHADVAGNGAGIRYLLDPAAVKSAIEAIPFVGSGNVVASGDGDPRSPVKLRFTGPVGGLSLPLLVSSTSSVVPARDFAGGILPRFRVNDVAVETGIPEIPRPYWGEGNYDSQGNPQVHTPYLAVAYFPFVQSAPDAEFQGAGQYESTLAGGWTVIGDSTAYAKKILTTTDPAARVVYRDEPLKAGVYRVHATWVEAAGRAPSVSYAVRNRAGTSLGTITVNQTVAPSGATFGGRPFSQVATVTLSGNTDGLIVTQQRVGTGVEPMVADGVMFERISADDSVRIQPGDVVTYSVGAGWLSTSAGPAPAATDAAVENTSGVQYIPPPPAPEDRRMGMGFGLGGANYFSSNYLYYDVARQMPAFSGTAFDSRGYPTRQAVEFQDTVVNVYRPSYEADGKGWPGLAPGEYALVWDGASDVTLGASEVGTPVLSGTTNRKRFYRVDATAESYGNAALSVLVRGTTPVGDGSWNADVRNVRIYPILPGVDIDAPPKFHPSVIQRLAGLQCIRPMDLTSTIIGSATHYADYQRPQDAASFGEPPRQYRIQMTRIEPYVGTTIWDPIDGQAWRITTAVPHNLSHGNWITFDTESTIGPATFSDGSSADFKLYTGHVRILSPTELYFLAGPKIYAAIPPVTSSTVFNNPAARLIASLGSPVPLADIVQLCNETHTDLHWNFAVCATDDCITQVGQFIAANLDPGLKCRATQGNEVWNFALGSFDYMSKETYRLGLGDTRDYVKYYCVRSKETWDLMQPAFDSAGRSSDLIRLLEGQAGYPAGPTARIARACVDYDIDFDEFAIAPYFGNQVTWSLLFRTEPPQVPLLDLFSVEQCLDLDEIHAHRGGMADQFQTHRDYLGSIPIFDGQGQVVGHDTRFAEIDYITYEGGPEILVPPLSRARAGRRSHGAVRHPRSFGINLAKFGIYDRTGCKLFNIYFLDGQDRSTYEMWSAYNGTMQAPYTPGRPAQDAIQVDQFDRLDLIESITGGAALAYALGFVPDPGTPARTGRRRIRGLPFRTSNP